MWCSSGPRDQYQSGRDAAALERVAPLGLIFPENPAQVSSLR
jgi:hypothetical protein